MGVSGLGGWFQPSWLLFLLLRSTRWVQFVLLGLRAGLLGPLVAFMCGWAWMDIISEQGEQVPAPRQQTTCLAEFRRHPAWDMVIPAQML